MLLALFIVPHYLLSRGPGPLGTTIVEMNPTEIAVLTTMQAAALAVYGAVIVIYDSLVKIDGRSSRKPSSRWFSIRQSQFTIAEIDERFHDG